MSTTGELLAEIAEQFPDNSSRAITPARLRQVCSDIVSSLGSAPVSVSGVLNFADEETYSTTVVESPSILATSQLVVRLSGDRIEEALVLGVGVQVQSQQDGSCVVAGACENGASETFNFIVSVLQ